MERKPPTKPTKYQKKGRPYFYAQYWEDRLDNAGNVVGRKQVYVPLVDEQGERITKPRAAERACEALYTSIVERWNGRSTTPESLNEYKERYIATRLRRAGTSRSYETKLRQFLIFLDDEHEVVRFDELRREHIKAYLDSRQGKVKPVTVHGDLRAIRVFLSEAVRDGHLNENPAKGIKLPALHGAHRSEGFFLPAEMDAIVEHCRENDKTWLPIMAGFRYAPFRREELCYLEWSDLDFERDVIHIQDEKPAFKWKPKRSGRMMDLHPGLKTVLETLPRNRGFVYAHPDEASYDDPVSDRRELGRKAWRKCKRLCELLELEKNDETGSWKRRFPKGPHLRAFRAGIACELQLRGAPLGYVQKLLGHHDQSLTLEHYTHIVPDLMGRLTKPFIETLGNERKPPI